MTWMASDGWCPQLSAWSALLCTRFDFGETPGMTRRFANVTKHQGSGPGMFPSWQSKENALQTRNTWVLNQK